MIFDTHAHYDDEAFDEDRDQLLSSMKDGGVGCIWRDLGIDESVSFCVWRSGGSSRRCRNYDTGYSG